MCRRALTDQVSVLLVTGSEVARRTISDRVRVAGPATADTVHGRNEDLAVLP